MKIEENVIDAEINEEEFIEEPEVVTEEKKSGWQRFLGGVKTHGPKIALAAGGVILAAASFALGVKVGSTKLDDDLPENALAFSGSDDDVEDNETDDEETTA